MQFIDLVSQQKKIKDKINNNIQAVLNHGMYIMGPEIDGLENRLSDFAGTRHGIGCASGTDALLLALMAYGVGPGDAIFVPTFTFIATAEVVSLLGATPIFVDIHPETFNMDTAGLEKAIEAVIHGNSRTHPLPRIENQPAGLTPKGIIPVDLFGLPADYDTICGIAKKYGLFVIEDAAQSFGAEHHGRKACSLANIACTSFFPAKPLGCYGDGGMCFTDSDELAELMKSLRVHGQGVHRYENVRIGINGRLDSLQAAILLAKFDIFPEELTARQQIADRYTRLLSGQEALCPPKTPAGMKSVWAQYSILARNSTLRKHIQEKLNEKGIPSVVYYPKPLHHQGAFRTLAYQQGDFPVSEDAASRIFSIPMHPYLSASDQDRIVEVILDCI
jgi:UDP-2-acetamido-2-deoxy-ribo-hexuluronate aminotransferase